MTSKWRDGLVCSSLVIGLPPVNPPVGYDSLNAEQKIRGYRCLRFYELTLLPVMQ